MKFIKSIPMATPSIALALATLGNLLLLPFGDVVRNVLGVLSFVTLNIFALKLCLDRKHAAEELKTPIPLSVLPTATMAIMILTTYIEFLGQAAEVIWYTALAVHVLIMLVFAKRFVIGFKLGTVFPTWFVAGVGIVTASVTAPAGAQTIARIAFGVGFVLYFAVLLLVIIRMNKVRIFPEPARNTIAIFTAPMALLTVGYFNAFNEINPAFLYFLLIGAVVSYVYVSGMMFSLIKINFYPTCAAFTFPYVISAMAFRIGSRFIYNRHGIEFLIPIADMTMWIAVGVVVFVLVHYVRYFRFWLTYR